MYVFTRGFTRGVIEYTCGFNLGVFFFLFFGLFGIEGLPRVPRRTCYVRKALPFRHLSAKGGALPPFDPPGL